MSNMSKVSMDSPMVLLKRVLSPYIFLANNSAKGEGQFWAWGSGKNEKIKRRNKKVSFFAVLDVSQNQILTFCIFP
jgi:hypothetical protein